VLSTFFGITEETVFPLSGGAAASSGDVQPPDVVGDPSGSATAWDVQIGGQPFVFANGEPEILLRQTADFRRQRIDDEREPGEQSLDSGFWLRSQTSYHYGAGSQSSEPVETEASVARFQFYKSGGVDVWTPGQVGLLNTTELVQASSASKQFALATGTGVLFAAGDSMWMVDNDGDSVSVDWGGTSDIESLATDGTDWYAGVEDAIYKGSLSGGTGAVMVDDFTGVPMVRWVKSRLMVAVGPSLYELTPASVSIGSAIYTHPTDGWVWSDMDEGPNAVYASGYGSAQSSIYRIGLVADNTIVPPIISLSAPSVITELPRGEIAFTLYGYLGAFMGIGTSKGVRVANVLEDGSLALGPIIIAIDTGCGCTDMVGVDRFLFVAGGNQVQSGANTFAPGLYRIDLGAEIAAGRYAYATDMVATSGTSRPVAVTANRTGLWFAVAEEGLFARSDDLVDEGWLLPGKIQFSTLERKAWRTLRGFGETGMPGSITFVVDDDGAGDPNLWTAIGTLSGDYPTNDFSVGTVLNEPSQEIWVGARLTGGAVLKGWVLRAVPAPRRSRLFEAVLLCMDFETDRNGLKTGSKGASWLRVQSLESMEDAGAPVTWRDFTTGEQATVVVERVQFTRRTPPSRQHGGTGGIVRVLMRTV
jgi:hypothetical protein